MFNTENGNTAEKTIYELIFEKSTKDLGPENLAMFADLLALVQRDDCTDNILNVSLVLLEYLSKVSAYPNVLFL